MTEFKQIIGRGTRLREDAGKTFFTILDFRGACELFKDPDFDGDPDVQTEWGEGDPVPTGGNDKKPVLPPITPPAPELPGVVLKPGENDGASGEKVVYQVRGVPVEVVGSSVSYLDENGNLVTTKFRDYTRRNILRAFGSEADFMEIWNGSEEKKAILERLEREGVLFDQLRKELKNPDADEFDLLCEIAFGRTPMTRQMRASRAARGKFLEKYQGVARKVLEIMIDIYAREGVREVDNIAVLRSEEFKELGGPVKVVKAFGGKPAYRAAIVDLENALYQPEESGVLISTVETE